MKKIFFLFAAIVLMAGIARAQVPTLTTINPSSTNATGLSIISGGSISSMGSSTITVRGVCWSTSVNPTTALTTKTNNGMGTGIFVSNITGLAPGTKYYIRAYATNKSGTAYGNTKEFFTPFRVGQMYGGGIVAYIYQQGDPGYVGGEWHGLIAAAANQSSGAPWGCYQTTIAGADGLALGTGKQNTIDIMAGCATAGIAARICGNLVLNGFSDWHLPSRDELYKLYIKRDSIGGFVNGYYWSSSEIGHGNSWDQNFIYGNQHYGIKLDNFYVRAVRTF